jgi:uncharacterized protein
MKITLSGTTGFIGTTLLRHFSARDWQVTSVGREAFSLPDDEFIEKKIAGSDVIIHLAGAPISKKWTPEWKKEMYDSRILTTRKIADCILKSPVKPSLFISTSAIGIYDSVHEHTESSTDLDNRFLGKLCQDWENEAFAVKDVVHTVIFRNGLVLGRDGGALKAMHTAFSMGLGGRIGDGNQAISSIHIDDLVAAYIFAIEHPEMTGIFNAVSPFPVTNSEFTTLLAKSLGQTTFLKIPTAVLKFRLGEGVITLLEGQKVYPERLQQAGFQWKHPTLQSALVQIYR